MQTRTVKELEEALRSQGLGALATISEVANVIKSSRGVVYDAVKRGDLECVRLGGTRAHMRIAAAAVARWMPKYRN
jgi:excisionase family DNA binding protein